MSLLDVLTGDFVEPVECVIKVDQQEIGDIYQHLTEITVNMSRREFTEAILKFESPADENGERVVADRTDLLPWSEITIDAVFGSKTDRLFSGVIFNVSPSFPNNSGLATLTLTCRDHAAKLSRKSRSQEWGEPDQPTTDQAILTEILSRHNLAPHAQNDPGMTSVVLRTNQTDIAFLQSRASDNGFDLIFFQDELYFGPPLVEAACQPTIMVYAGKKSNCYSFDITNSGENFESLAVTGRDDDGNPDSEEVVTPNLPLMGAQPARNPGNGLEDHQAFMADCSSPNAEVQTRRAQARVNEQSLSVKAKGELDGAVYNNVLLAGQPVAVDGVGELYSGLYLVDTVTHTINHQGYRQSFELLRNAVGYVPCATSLGAAIGGVL